MWAAAAYAAGCRGTGPVAICTQACCAGGALRPCLPGAGHETAAGHPAQSWEPAVVCPELFTSHKSFFFGLQQGQKEYENAQLELVLQRCLYKQ